MQPVSDNRLQPQIIPAQPKTPDHRDASTYPTTTSPNRNTFALPEDVVNLSTDRSSILESPVNKKPSVPVSAGERKALQDNFSVDV